MTGCAIPKTKMASAKAFKLVAINLTCSLNIFTSRELFSVAFLKFLITPVKAHQVVQLVIDANMVCHDFWSRHAGLWLANR